MSTVKGIQLDQINALIDAQFYVQELGSEIVLRMISDESKLERGRYGGIKNRTPTNLVLHAHPITWNPTQEQLEKAGIQEKVDVMITLATKDLTDNELKYADIDEIRWEVSIGSPESETDSDFNTGYGLFSIKDKSLKNRFSHTHLNIVLGLTKK